MLELLLEDLRLRVRRAASLLFFDREPEHPEARARRLRAEAANRDIAFLNAGGYRPLQEAQLFLDAVERAENAPPQFTISTPDQFSGMGSMLRSR